MAILMMVNWFRNFGKSLIQVDGSGNGKPGIDLCEEERVDKVQVSGRSSAARTKLRFSRDHPQYSTHCVIKRRRLAIPDIIGPRLPNRDDMSAEKSELYGSIALTLYRAHRNRSDLLGDFSNFHDAFEDWKLVMPTEVETWLRYNQEYYVGKAKAAEHRAKLIEELDARFANADAIDDNLNNFR